MAEGHPDDGVSFLNPKGLANGNIGNGSAGIVGSHKQVRPPCVYRWDPSGRLDVVVEGRPGLVPNGIAFSPDYTKVYFVWGTGIDVADVVGSKIANQRRFTDCNVDGVHCGPDGHRVDVAGNVWSGSTSVPAYMRVTVWNPTGQFIGSIRLSETCANGTFCDPKRDWLWILPSLSIWCGWGYKGRHWLKAGATAGKGLLKSSVYGWGEPYGAPSPPSSLCPNCRYVSRRRENRETMTKIPKATNQGALPAPRPRVAKGR